MAKIWIPAEDVTGLQLAATADSCFASAAAAARTAAPIGFVFFAPVPKPDNAFDIKEEALEESVFAAAAAVVVAVVAAVNMNGLLLLKDLILAK